MAVMIVSKSPQTTAAARVDYLQEKPDARLIKRIKTNEMHGERADIIANSTYFPSEALYRLSAPFVPTQALICARILESNS